MPSTGAEDTDLVRRRVINVVGHELRTPITTVRGLADQLAHLLEGSVDGEAVDVVLPALVRNARRAEELLDDLLIASEVTTAHPVEPSTSVDLDAIVREVVDDAELTVEGSAPRPAQAHRTLVTRALGHIVSNATRYHDGRPSLHFEADEDTVSVVVVTPVSGEIPDLELSFEVFFRGEDAVTRSPGIGVGLPAARALARVDGGDVTLEQDRHQVITRLTLPGAA